MEEIIANDILNDKILMNILFLVAYQIIISIISYKVLERYSWKENAIANLVITLGVSFIKLNGLDFIKILTTAIVQTATMVVVENYMYNKDYDIRDYIFRTTFLNTFAAGGEIMTCLLWVASDSIIKTFGLIILLVLGVNTLGYIILSGGQSSGILMLIDSVVYVIVLFVFFKIAGIDMDMILSTTTTTNNVLKLIMLCVAFGIVTAVSDKGAYEETEDMKGYMVIGSLKTYAANMTIVLGIYIYLLHSIAQLFSEISF